MSWFRSQIAAITSSRESVRQLSNHSLQSSGSPRDGGANTKEPLSDFEQFQLFWRDTSFVLSKQPSNTDKPVSRTTSINDCDVVIHFTDKMVKMITSENSSSCCDPQFLNYLYMEEVFDRLITWSEQRPEYKSRLKLHLLCMYDALIGHSQQQVLTHKQFIKPLLRVLDACKNDQIKDEHIEEKLLVLLHQLCIAVTQNTSLLDLLADSTGNETVNKYFDISILLPYVHRVGSVGQQARDDLLLLMSLSCINDNIVKYVTERTDFCQVLVVSLSGLYSSLPRTLSYDSDDWHRITDEDVANTVDLQMFLNVLEFCSALVQVSHPLIQNQLLTFIYSGFLVSVLGPTLHQVQSGMEEAIAVTAYLDLFVRKIVEPRLLRIFLQFVLLGKMDDVTVLEALIQRITSPNTRLCMVTLTLFRTLIDLNCEDIMYQLIFKYLLPCSHIMISQQRSVTEKDIYCKTAEKLISTIPTCCTVTKSGDFLLGCHTVEDSSTDSQWMGRFANSVCESLPPSPASSSPSTFQRSKANWFSFRTRTKSVALAPAIAFDNSPVEARNAFFPRQADEMAGGAISYISNSQLESSSPSFKNCSSPWESCYVDYLQMAHASMSECIKACRNWSSRYAGEGQTLTSLTASPGRSATDRFSSDVSSSSGSQLDSVGCTDIKECNLAQNSNESDPVCDEIPESGGGVGVGETQMSSKINDDLLSFLVQLNRIQVSDASEDIGNILLELDSLLADLMEQEFSDIDDQSASEIEIPETAVLPRLCEVSGTEQTAVGSAETRHDGTPNSTKIISQAQGSSAALNSTHTGPAAESKTSDVSVTPSASSISKRIIDGVGSPTIGPFLTALLNKLELMKQNTLYVNLQLTGLVARLACYPQPLLSSLLLSHTLVFQPSVKSLMQVLNSIKCRLEEYFYKVKEKDQMFEQAYRFLLWRLDKNDGDKTSAASRRHSLMSLNPSKAAGESRMGSMMSRLKLLDNKRGAHYIVKKPTSPSAVNETQEMTEKKNAIYGAVVFKEFLKELAAISQEHAMFLLADETSS